MDQNIDLSNMTSAQRDNLMSEVKTQIALANVQELLEKLSDKCVKKCITKPGSALDKSDEKCLSFCVERFMNTWDIVSRAYQQRLQREAGGLG